MKIAKEMTPKIDELFAVCPPTDTHRIELRGLDAAYMQVCIGDLEEGQKWAICYNEATGEISAKMLSVDDTRAVPYRNEDGLVVCRTTACIDPQDIADAVFVAVAVLSGRSIDSDPELRAAAATKCIPVYDFGVAAQTMEKYPLSDQGCYALMYDVKTKRCWVDVYDSDDPIRAWPDDEGPYVLCPDRPGEVLCGVYKELPKMRAVWDDAWSYETVIDNKNGTVEQTICDIANEAMFKIAEIRDYE